MFLNTNVWMYYYANFSLLSLMDKWCLYKCSMASRGKSCVTLQISALNKSNPADKCSRWWACLRTGLSKLHSRPRVFHTTISVWPIKIFLLQCLMSNTLQVQSHLICLPIKDKFLFVCNDWHDYTLPSGLTSSMNICISFIGKIIINDMSDIQKTDLNSDDTLVHLYRRLYTYLKGISLRFNSSSVSIQSFSVNIEIHVLTNMIICDPIACIPSKSTLSWTR